MSALECGHPWEPRYRVPGQTYGWCETCESHKRVVLPRVTEREVGRFLPAHPTTPAEDAGDWHCARCKVHRDLHNATSPECAYDPIFVAVDRIAGDA